MHSLNCPEVGFQAPADFEEAIKDLDELLDLYTDCRLRMGALVEFERNRK